jgi:hypothetical protein
VPQKQETDCPKCGAPDATRKPEQEGGDNLPIERALRCDACDDTYVRIKGRWWSTKS